MSGPAGWRSSRRRELTADHLMASACLPTIFQAVEIDGVPYWDGGYMANPALYPLFDETVDQRHHAGADQPVGAAADAAFTEAMRHVGRSRRRTGAGRWELFRGGGESTRFVESYLVGTWAERVRQRENRLTGADRRFKEQARAYAVGEPQVAHLLPPACEGAAQEAVDGQTPASPQSLRFPAVNSVAAQRTSSRR